MAPRWIKTKDRQPHPYVPNYGEHDWLLLSGEWVVGRVLLTCGDPHRGRFNWGLTGPHTPAAPVSTRGMVDSEDAAKAELLVRWRRTISAVGAPWQQTSRFLCAKAIHSPLTCRLASAMGPRVLLGYLPEEMRARSWPLQTEHRVLAGRKSCLPRQSSALDIARINARSDMMTLIFANTCADVPLPRR